MRLSHKIFLYFGTSIFSIVLVLVMVNYLVLGRILHQNAKEETRKIVESVSTAAATVLDSSIRNYMRGVIEQDFIILEELYRQSQDGILTEQQAKDAFQEYVLEHVIGESGYIVALRPENEQIWIDIHPHVRGTDCSFNQGCQEWVVQKNGYNEYEWQNPDDNKSRQKVGYFQYFEPWNWIVGATSYKDEFTGLVKIDALRELIEPFRIMENGYFFVMDDNFKMLIHPEIEGEYVYNLQNEEGAYIAQEAINNLNDFYYYRWKNPNEEVEREKVLYAKILDDFNWYIFASGYLEDITAPVKVLLYFRLVFIIAVAFILLFITLLLSRSLTRPLDTMIQGLNTFYKEKKVFNMAFNSVQELNAVGHAIESMTENLIRTEQDKQSVLKELEAIINSMPSMLIGVDIKSNVTLWNNKAAEYFGISRKEAIGRPVSEVTNDFTNVLPSIQKNIDSQTFYSHTFEISNNDSSTNYYDVTFYPLQAGMQSAVIRIDDISERVMMEESLMQRQKMESLGTLAGGIAHDFNNMLSAIYGYAELTKAKLEPESPCIKLQSQLIKATNRARDLVSQILLFSKQAEHKRKPVDPHLITKEVLKLLRPLIPATIDIKQDISCSSGTILADPTQLHQIIMNLCTNAYHAMRKEGGTMSVSLSSVKFSDLEADLSRSDFSSSNYVKLEVSDTGCGMDQVTLAKIFDPFFTTKATGEGTGLGLSVVHGVVKSYQGHIKIDSELDKGTTVQVFLPTLDFNGDTLEVKEELPLPKGSEHILLVDDEDLVLDTTRRLLESFGYKVTISSSSVKALEFFQANPNTFDLVITDMTMPQMTGLELTKKMFAIKQTIPVIMCTGFSENINKEQAYAIGIKRFLAKPLMGGELANAIHETIHQ